MPVARLRNVKPTIQVRRGNTLISEARERTDLRFGDIVRTGEKGKTDIIFSNGTQVALRERTQIELIAPDSPDKPLVIRVFGALSEVFVRPGGNVQVRTAAAVAGARGTAFLVRLPTDGTTELTVVEDVVEFFNARGRVIVNANQQSTAREGEPPSPPVAVDVSGNISWTAEISALPTQFETLFSPADLLTLRARSKRAQEDVRAAPDSVEARLRLGEVLYDLGSYASAVNEFQAAARLAPNSVTVLVHLSQAERAQGDSSAAIEHAKRALTQSAESGQARMHLALAYLSGKRVELARSALAPIESTPEARAVLGLILLREGHTAQATILLESARERNPLLYQAHALLALAYLNRNDLASANASSRRATFIQPYSSQTQGTRAAVFFFSGRQKDAIQAADIASRLNPFSPISLLTKGRALLSQARLDEALSAYRQAKALAPDMAAVHVELGRVYLRMDQPSRAEASFRRAIALAPELADSHTGLGSALQLTGRDQEARAAHERALQLQPTNVAARENLAALFVLQGRLVDARLQAAQGVMNQPDRGILYVRLSEITLLQRQDFHGAEEFARKAVQLLPASAEAHYQLGRVYLEEGRNVQAEQEFRQSVTLDRRFADARFALGFARSLTESVVRGVPAILKAADLGSLGSLISALNLQAPGNEERIQAAIQDPTVVRIASRAFGDTQVDAAGGDLDSQSYRLSSLSTSANRRGLVGFSAEHGDTAGFRDNADEHNSRLGVTLGHKPTEGTPGNFVLAQHTRQRKGLNGQDIGGIEPFIDLGMFGSAPFGLIARRRTETPLVMWGTNKQHSDRSRTRTILQWSKPESAYSGVLDFDITQTLDNLNFELRHDLQWNERNLASAGFSVGGNRVRQATLERDVTGVASSANYFDSSLRLYTGYLRNETQISKDLSITGDIQVQGASLAITQPDPDNLGIYSRTTDTVRLGLWTLIAAYRPDAQSGIRIRARKLVGRVSDFQLLAPTDVFFNAPSDLPILALQGQGRSYELEYDHTLRNASLLRVSVFRQQLVDAVDALQGPTPSDPWPAMNLRGARLEFEGSMSREVAFFLNTTYIDANGISAAAASGGSSSGGGGGGGGGGEGGGGGGGVGGGGSGGEDSVSDGFQRASFIPLWSGEAGLQYFSSSGWFVQPSMSLRGGTRSLKGFVPGFGVLNLRFGKRFGLRSTIFVEVLNVLNKKYDLFYPGLAQAGTVVRAGFTRRF